MWPFKKSLPVFSDRTAKAADAIEWYSVMAENFREQQNAFFTEGRDYDREAVVKVMQARKDAEAELLTLPQDAAATQALWCRFYAKTMHERDFDCHRAAASFRSLKKLDPKSFFTAECIWHAAFDRYFGIAMPDGGRGLPTVFEQHPAKFFALVNSGTD